MRDEISQEAAEESDGDNDSESSSLVVYSVTWRAKTPAATNTSGVVSRQREINTTNTTLFIDELQPDTAYSINVCAVFGHTRSPSVSLDARTLAERPIPSRPLDLRAEFVDLLAPLSTVSAVPATSTSVGDDSSQSTESNRVLRVSENFLLEFKRNKMITKS